MNTVRRRVTDDELSERQGKLERFQADVVGLPKVTRNSENEVRKVTIETKVRFKGTVILTLTGDAAAAYWSVTPGMRLQVGGVETGKGEYDAETIDLLPARTEG